MKAVLRQLRAVCRLICFAGVTVQISLVFAVVFPFLKEASRMRYVGYFSSRLLAAMGLVVHSSGRMGVGSTLLVANHVSWLDILAINAARPVRFVSKADVRHWPLVGWIVACGGTLFIERERRSDAMRVVHQVAEALRSGSQIAIFPEGTTSDGRGVLPFHASLLQSAVATGVDVQPILMRYSDAQASISESANYVGDTTLAQSMWLIANASDLTVHVSFLPVAVGPHPDRRVLGDRLRAGIEKELLAAQVVRP